MTDIISRQQSIGAVAWLLPTAPIQIYDTESKEMTNVKFDEERSANKFKFLDKKSVMTSHL